jgi:hypothetical protein
MYNKPIAVMSYELINRSTEITRTFSRQFWAKALELARLYGWKPVGTYPPTVLVQNKLSDYWLGTYLTNDGQLVKTADAFWIADALEKSLDNIPASGSRINWSSKFWLEDDLPEWLSPEEREFVEEELQDGLLDIMGTGSLEFFAGEEKPYLAALIKFCRLGSFEIPSSLRRPRRRCYK